MRSRLIALAAILAALLVTSALAAPSWRTVTTIAHPFGLAVDLRGNPSTSKWAYTTDYFHFTVLKFGTGGRVLRAWSYGPVTRYKQGAGVAVGGSGNVFVADASNGRVRKFSPGGRLLATLGPFQLPVSVAVDRAGNIYVAEEGAFQITKLSPGGAVLAHWSTPWVNGAPMSDPFAVAVDRQGNIYTAVHCHGDNCPPPHGVQEAVLRLNSQGVMQSNLLGNNPYTGRTKEEEPFVTVGAIAVDRSGALYVAGSIRGKNDTFAPGVLVYGGGTTLQARYTLPGSDTPTGIALDARGTIYVAAGSKVMALRR